MRFLFLLENIELLNVFLRYTFILNIYICLHTISIIHQKQKEKFQSDISSSFVRRLHTLDRVLKLDP